MGKHSAAPNATRLKQNSQKCFRGVNGVEKQRLPGAADGMNHTRFIRLRKSKSAAILAVQQYWEKFFK